ncbi:asparaginase [Rothia sp. P6271]|uniref:asparaginase n=1 Tax=unclassified Rothia (in: high G+C Gram-positive bacteria) TaxID=2689056 RepID=UPI003AC80C81
MPTAAENTSHESVPRKRLERYPERFRARVGGRVVHVTLSAPTEPPRYTAVLEVRRSKPLAPSNYHQLTGIPIIEVLEEDSDDETQEVIADDDDSPEETLTDIEEYNIPQYRVSSYPKTPAPLYPEFPPLAEGDYLELIWHGQRNVPGIVAGTYIRCSGMLSQRVTPHRMYNPRYEIVPSHIAYEEKHKTR